MEIEVKKIRKFNFAITQRKTEWGIIFEFVPLNFFFPYGVVLLDCTLFRGLWRNVENKNLHKVPIEFFVHSEDHF